MGLRPLCKQGLVLFFHEARNHVGWKWKIQSIIWRHPKYPDVWHHVDKRARWLENKFSLFQLEYVLVSVSYQRSKYAQVTSLRKWVPGGIENSKSLKKNQDCGYCTCKALGTIRSSVHHCDNNLLCYWLMLPALTLPVASTATTSPDTLIFFRHESTYIALTCLECLLCTNQLSYLGE